MAFITTHTAQSTCFEENTYILKTGKAGAAHLENQHQIMAEKSFEHLYKTGLHEGQTVVDVGCGNGTVTEYLAETVGPNGRVYAIDISPQQIELTKERLAKVGLNNVMLIEGNICEVEGLCAQADIVYARLLLMHLKDPLAAIKKMCSFLKPKGTIALQESTMNTLRLSVPNKALEEYRDLLIALGVHNGTDFNIGDKLEELCLQAGLKVIDTYCINYQVPLPQARTAQRLKEIKDELLSANLVTATKLAELEHALKELSTGDPTIYLECARQTFIIATPE